MIDAGLEFLMVLGGIAALGTFAVLLLLVLEAVHRWRRVRRLERLEAQYRMHAAIRRGRGPRDLA